MNWKVISFILLIALLGCKKDPIQFKIAGKINDTSFNTGLSGASVAIYQVLAGTTKKVLVTTVTTDSDGNYTVAFNRDQVEKYYIDCSKDNYFSTEKLVYFSDLTTDKTNTVNIDIEAIATVNWVIKNQPPAQATDIFQIQKLNGKTDCDACCVNKIYEYDGASINETLTCQTKGNTYLKFIKIDKQLNSSTLDSIYCPAFQSVNYPVNY